MASLTQCTWVWASSGRWWRTEKSGVLQSMGRKELDTTERLNWTDSLEGLMLKLKLQYFGHLMWRADWLEKPWCWQRLKAGREGDNRGWDGWMASPTQCTWVWASSGSWWWTGKPGVLLSRGLQRIVRYWATKLNWTENKDINLSPTGNFLI